MSGKADGTKKNAAKKTPGAASVRKAAVGEGKDAVRGLGKAENKKSSPALLTAEEFGALMKKKGRYAVFALIVAAVWVILLGIFPLPFYSLFFASNLGSNVLLIFMAAVLSFPVNWAFSKISGADIRSRVFLAVNVVMLVAVVYVYSIFWYMGGFIWPVLAAAVHWGAMVAVFSRPRGSVMGKAVSKGKLVLLGAACAALSDFLYLLMFTLVLNVFRE